MSKKKKQENSVSENQKVKTDSKKKKADVKKSVKKREGIFSKFYTFLILDIIAILLLFYFLGEIRRKGVVLNNLINTYQNAKQSSQVNFADLEIKSNKEKADKIMSIFPDDQGLLDFIKLIEEKNEVGTVVNFNFATKEPVRDGTTKLGIPVVVNFKGTWAQIDKDLRDIQSSQFLFRPITIEIKKTAEEGVVELMYGGFLYVDESF